MSREEIQKLLGGYATDTLSNAERSALFEAALADQELFDALAKEQALRDVLQDPSARQRLIVALGPAREQLRWWRRPAALALAGSFAVLLIGAGLLLRPTRHLARQQTTVADAITLPQAAPVPPAFAPIQKTEPAVVSHKKKRLAQLPLDRVVRAQQAVATASPSPPPPSRATQAAGGLAGGPQAQSQMVEVDGQSVTLQNQPPMPAMARAKMAARASANPAVAYTLLERNADGSYSSVPSNTIFHAGDSVRLEVRPSEAGYVYLFQRPSATAGWTLVTSQPVEKGQRYELPSTGGIESDVRARLELWLALSPLEHLEADSLPSQAAASSRISIEYR
jgi:hypothetical protein